MMSIENSGAGAASAADLLAHVVLLLVQRRLLELGDVAAVLARHAPLFLADLVVLRVEPSRPLLRELTFLDLTMDAGVLTVQAVVHLLAARMRLLPGVSAIALPAMPTANTPAMARAIKLRLRVLDMMISWFLDFGVGHASD
jgi:hypothetical protein